MTFVVQSAEHDPRDCEQRIYRFLKENVVNQQTFDDYRKGQLAKKRAGFRDAKEEWQHLKGQFKQFSTDGTTSDFMWDKLLREADYYENQCTLQKLNQVYEETLLQDTAAVYCVFSQKHCGIK